VLAVVFVPRRSRVVWTPGMPPKRKDSRRNRDAPALLFQITARSMTCQMSAQSGLMAAPRNYENGRSAMECGSEAAAMEFEAKAVAGATALQGAFATTIFKAVVRKVLR